MSNLTQKKRKSRSPVSPVPESSQDTVIVDRKQFQILHSAARAVFRSILTNPNPTQDMALSAMALDEAIDEGHRALGTERASADKYVQAVGGLLYQQLVHARQILERENMDVPVVDVHQ